MTVIEQFGFLLFIITGIALFVIGLRRLIKSRKQGNDKKNQ